MASTVTTGGDWEMNKDSLAKGMLIRRPGLKEALEVLEVKSGQAKVRLSDGKNTTISAKAEVLYRWPEKAKAEIEKEKESPSTATKPKPQSKPTRATPKSTPTTLLKPGSRIIISGVIHQVLRLTETNIRIKNEDTGGLSSVPIDFNDYETVRDSKPGPKKGETRARQQIALPIEEEESGGETDTEEEGEIPDDVKEEIEKAFRSEDENQDHEQENEEEVEEIDTTHEEENDMASVSEWLTVQELSEEVGLSVVKINQLRKDKEIPAKLYKSDPDDQRRIIYHRDLVEKLGNRTPARRGRKPGPSKEFETSKPRVSRPEPERQAESEPSRPSRQVAPPTTAVSGSLDTYLSKAIEAAEGQIAQLQELVTSLDNQREALRIWS